MAWDAQQYLTFSDHRLQPAIDLLSRIKGIANFTPNIIYDLGCGPGNITNHMQQLWPKASITGVDSSAEMLAKAKTDFPHMQWLTADIDQWKPTDQPNLIFSNAALHWLDHHDQLFPKLMSYLPKNGVLALQIPNNFARPTHMLVAEAAKNSECYDKLALMFKPSPTQSPSYYYEALSPYCQHIDIWQTDYLQVLSGKNPVADWTKGSWLRPFLAALSEPDKSHFERNYRDLIKKAYPTLSDGKTLLPFKRLFILAVK